MEGETAFPFPLHIVPISTRKIWHCLTFIIILRYLPNSRRRMREQLPRRRRWKQQKKKRYLPTLFGYLLDLPAPTVIESSRERLANVDSKNTTVTKKNHILTINIYIFLHPYLSEKKHYFKYNKTKSNLYYDLKLYFIWI